MRSRSVFAVFGALLCLVAPLRAQAAEGPDSEMATARSKALELAGAFANDGYRLRDGYWSADIEPGRGRLLAVNLFAGNEYWFSAAVAAPGRKVAVTLYDPKGRPVEFQIYEDGPVAAAGFMPSVSGKYLVKVRLTEGEKADFCLLYSYK